jgi:hypothetical protein
VAAVFGISAIAIGLVNVPPSIDCSAGVPVAATQHWFRATQTVIQPWRGRHHVYGLFNVPDQYEHDDLYTARLIIQGIDEEFPEISPEGEDSFDDQAEPGHYIKRIYLPTRTALWLALTARFGDLKTTCHWWIVIMDRKG